jgi:hypothetical protein
MFSPRWIIAALLVIVTLTRSLVFLIWEQSFFDSNQAVIGLMAKHLAEGRTFPVFMYGQNYMLAVESWLAAPLFLIVEPSVAALKAPLLVLNLAIASVLFLLLQRDGGLKPAPAGMASIFFVFPAPGTAAQLLEASGAIFESLLYVLLVWVARQKPLWLGLVLGVGFLHREFTIYGLAALILLEAAHRRLATRDTVKRLAVAIGVGAAIWTSVQVLNTYAPAMGPGTTLADLKDSETNVEEIAGRICLDVNTLATSLERIVTVHWPLLFGTSVVALRRFDIESNVIQGLPYLGLILASAMVLAGVRTSVRLAARRRWSAEDDFFAYLVLVGLFSASGYALARCGAIDIFRMRYDFLSLLGAIGLSAWFLRLESSRYWIGVWLTLVLVWTAAAASAHGYLWREYLRDTPVGGKQRIIAELNERGIRYAAAGYSDAYVISFLTDERIIVTADRVRIASYQRDVHRHAGEAVRIVRRRFCEGGEEVMRNMYLCPL